MTEKLLSRTTYRQVVKKLDHYRKQHEEDRAENPNAIPIEWGRSLERMVENTVRANHERCWNGLGAEVLAYLAEQGLLISYHGGYTFPGTTIPSREEIEKKAKEALQ